MADLIGQYLLHLRTLNRAEATIDTYGDILRLLDRTLPYGLASAHADELRDAIFTARRSPATRKLYRAAVAAFYRWATDPDDERLDYDPTRHLPNVQPPRRSPRPIPTDQLADILRRAAEPYRTWYVLAAYGGLRCVEISHLDREHATAETLWIHGKGSHERTIPTDAYIWTAVRDLPPGPVAVTPDGTQRADRREVMDRGNHHLRSLGLEGVTMHRFRHTFATLIYQQTGDILLTRTLLGHASVATTQVYAQVASPAMAAAVAGLPRLNLPASAAAAAA